MSMHPLAGKPAPVETLVDLPRLVAAYYTHRPDPDEPGHAVAFGTSGHRGSSLKSTFTETHILAIAQAIAEYRAGKGYRGPLFLGMDTHALSEAAFRSAVEVFAANGVELRIQAGAGYTPTPVISHAVLGYNRGRDGGFADGVVITPSHNPPRRRRLQIQPARWRSCRHRCYRRRAEARERHHCRRFSWRAADGI